MFFAAWFPGGAERAKIDGIRTEVFVEERGIPYEEEFKPLDAAAYLLIAQEDGTPTASARLCLLDDSLRADSIAVRKPYREQGYDEFALRMLLFKAREMPFSKVTADVPEAEADLYKKLGFGETGGIDLKHGIKYIRLTMNRDDIVLEGSCGH